MRTVLIVDGRGSTFVFTPPLDHASEHPDA
jgi:hypothetical protein